MNKQALQGSFPGTAIGTGHHGMTSKPDVERMQDLPGTQ